MESGQDMGGNSLDGAVEFCAGAIVTPEAQPIEPQLIKFEKKVEAGAEFFQTQAIYDLDQFAAFMRKIDHLDVPVLAGIILLKSAGMARFMNRNVAGVHVPERLINRMEEAEDKVAASIGIAAELVKGMKELCRGVHIMALGWEKWVPNVLTEAGL